MAYRERMRERLMDGAEKPMEKPEAPMEDDGFIGCACKDCAHNSGGECDGSVEVGADKNCVAYSGGEAEPMESDEE